MTRQDNFVQFAEILEKHARVVRDEKDLLAQECVDEGLSVSDVVKRLYDDIRTELVDESLIFEDDEQDG